MPRILHAQHDSFPLSTPFRISRGVKTQAEVIAVGVTEGGITGRGEGVPYARYGESIESALAAIGSVRAPIEGGAGRDVLMTLLPPGAARNALDCALWDLETRLSGRSVAETIGAPEPGRIESALTIGIDNPLAMGLAASKVADAPLLKIKVDAVLPDAQIRAVRNAAPNARLIVDPNESWNERVVDAMQRLLVDMRVDLLEQPVPADADAWLEGYTSAVPICADESVHVAADLDVIARRYSHVNVKLDKAGGLTAALELAHAARARGMGLMTGCMISSSLSIAPALHVAALSDFVDLDGPIWLREDREGGVRDERGYLIPPQQGFWGTS